VSINDYVILVGVWGPCPEPCPPICLGDLDGDCSVGITDYIIMVGNWG
jgi:hypothetical protein